MVLEHLFPEDWLEKRGRYAFILGICYSVIGILFAKLLFPEDPALVSVAFISLLLLPELYKMFTLEERKETKEKRFSFPELYKDNKDFVKTYLLLFLGIFITYAILTVVLSNFEANNLFAQQLEIRSSAGKATGLFCSESGVSSTFCLFEKILTNNFWVLVACFLLSLITGDGAVFLITWNASVWGTLFGDLAKRLAYYRESVGILPPFLFLGMILLIVFPHMILEALAYIMSAVSGGTISKDVILEKIDSTRFKHVFIYNIVLFLIAILVIILAVAVETLVLTYSESYRSMLRYS